MVEGSRCPQVSRFDVLEAGLLHGLSDERGEKESRLTKASQYSRDQDRDRYISDNHFTALQKRSVVKFTAQNACFRRHTEGVWWLPPRDMMKSRRLIQSTVAGIP